MVITDLRISGFRNIDEQTLAPGPRLNLIVGANGQGKTNLVEAVAFASWFRSFRTGRTADLVGRGRESAFVGVGLDGRGGRHEVEVAIGPGWRRGTLDGRAVRSVRDTLRVLTVASLSPDDPAVLEGGPDGRRALLDRLVVLRDPDRAADLSKYGRLVRERNELLRAAPGTWDERAVAACEEALAAAGAAVARARTAALAELTGRLQAELIGMAGTDLVPEVRYAARWLKDASPGQAEGALLATLRARRGADAAVGYTTAGPHADDLEVGLLGLRARGHASRGQKKVLMLAWKVAEAGVFAADRGEDPVLVLDDALADLDAERQARVVARLSAWPGQSFLTGAAMPTDVLALGRVFVASAGTFA